MDAVAPTPVPAVPTGARRVAYAGLMPFVMSALLIWIVRPEVLPYVTHALTAYTGVVVALLAGVHWGLMMRRGDDQPRRYAVSAAIAVGAWVGLMMRPDAGLVLQGAMLVAGYLVDRRLYPAEGLSAWLTLRFRFSALAALCCFIGAANA
jgi:hypothetical protein